MYTIDLRTGRVIFVPVNATTFSEGEYTINAEETNDENKTTKPE